MRSPAPDLGPQEQFWLKTSLRMDLGSSRESGITRSPAAAVAFVGSKAFLSGGELPRQGSLSRVMRRELSPTRLGSQRHLDGTVDRRHITELSR